jgi:hypothetical protein
MRSAASNASCTRGCEEPHWLSTVVAATLTGRPAVSQAVRETLNACMPTWLMHPPTT